MNTPIIETERLILRKFIDYDVDDMLLLYSDEEFNKFLPWFPIKTRADMVKYLHNSIFPFYERNIAYSYAISQKSHNRVIGYVHVNDIGESNDIGYALRKESWGQGIITEAGRAVVEQLKKDEIPYITATHDVKNPRSGNVMRKLGMKYQYSYEEQWQPKDILVTFRMYQLNLDGQKDRVYKKYWNNSDIHFVETDV